MACLSVLLATYQPTQDCVVTDPNSLEWDCCFDMLQLYKEEYGDCNAPRKWKDHEGLGKWAIQQQYALKPNVAILTAKRNGGATCQEMLHEIGLVWNLRLSKKWQTQDNKQ